MIIIIGIKHFYVVPGRKKNIYYDHALKITCCAYNYLCLLEEKKVFLTLDREVGRQ
jgi:hypothetical protein